MRASARTFKCVFAQTAALGWRLSPTHPTAYFRIGLVLIDILRPTFNPEIGGYPAIIGDFLE